MDLKHEDIYAIGDSFNDIPMIEEFHGCAMMHARSAITEAAEHVFISIEECIAYLMRLDAEADAK